MNTEALLRRHLEAAAARVDVTDTPVADVVGDVRRSRMWFGLGAIAAVLLAIVAAAGLMSRNSDDLVGPQPTVSDGGIEADLAAALPSGFDVETAIAVFAGNGSATEVALQYLDDRIGVDVAVLSEEEIEAGLVAIRWGWGRIAGVETSNDEGDLGWIVAREVDAGISEILAATTDGISLAGTSLAEGRLSVLVENASGSGSLALDVLDLAGEPIAGAVNPDGIPGADERFGTAGVTDDVALEFVASGITEPVTVRAQQVGGTLLTVSEFILGPEGLAPSENTLPPESTTTVPTTTTIPEGTEVAWTAADAERDVENYLAALAAGAYEQAAWPLENNGGAFDGQRSDETPAQYLERVCAGGVCSGPYTVLADGPGVINEFSQASSTVTVTAADSGDTVQFSVFTFEGQRIVTGVPPVATGGEPGLIEQLFGTDIPERVVVQRFDAFEIWEDGRSEWVTNWWAEEIRSIEQDYGVGWGTPVVGVSEPSTDLEVTCGTLMTRGSNVLVLDQCQEGGWVYTDLATGSAVTPPIPGAPGEDGQSPWFAERGATTLTGTSDAEGNLFRVEANEVNVTGDDYVGYVRLSVDGSMVAYVDHADPNAYSHFWSPVVVVRDVATGSEVDRWVLDGPVLGLEFSDDWVVAWEASSDPEELASGLPRQVAAVAINVATGEVNRVETGTRVFLPS